MMHDQLATFTDRLEAIALFNMLRGRDPDNSWPLLPILAFVAPGGSGKSLLLRHLLYWLLSTSVRKIAIFALFSSLFAWLC